MKPYFDESFRQLNIAITMPITTVTGPMMDHVVVLLIGLPARTPNPRSAQIRPNAAKSNPTAKVTTKPCAYGDDGRQSGEVAPKPADRTGVTLTGSKERLPHAALATSQGH